MILEGISITSYLFKSALHAHSWPSALHRQPGKRDDLFVERPVDIDTGSRMDEVIFEEFKGTGNSLVHHLVSPLA